MKGIFCFVLGQKIVKCTDEHEPTDSKNQWCHRKKKIASVIYLRKQEKMASGNSWRTGPWQGQGSSVHGNGMPAAELGTDAGWETGCWEHEVVPVWWGPFTQWNMKQLSVRGRERNRVSLRQMKSGSSHLWEGEGKHTREAYQGYYAILSACLRYEFIGRPIHTNNVLL